MSKEQKSIVLCRLLSFLIPAGIVALVCVRMGFYPFGDKSVLMADMRYQFVDYYAYYKKLLFDKNDIFYTFQKTFGGDMAGLLAYYCNTPFLFLLAFVPNEALPGGILILMIVMIGLCGLDFHIFLERVFGFRISALIFSTAYALCGYLMGYFNCTLYFFDVALLPLVMTGLVEILRSGKVSLLYIWTLALAVFSSYYIGYMICLFSVLFFLYCYFSMYKTIPEVRKHLRAAMIYAASSVLAVGISAVSLFCAMFSLRGQKNSGLSLSGRLNFAPLELFSGLYTGAFHGNVSDGLPLIYIGAIGGVLSILFFVNKNIELRRKLLAAVVLLLLILSFVFDPLNVVWHGFAHPIGFPYRFSFLFSFFLLFLAFHCFVELREAFTPWVYGIVFAIIVLYSAYLFSIRSPYAGHREIVLTLVFSAAALISLYLCKYGKQYMMPIVLGMVLLECADAGYNAYHSIAAYFPGFEETDDYDMSKYTGFLAETGELVDYVRDRDDGLYRLEKYYRRSNNDAMMFGYKGLSHFSSCETGQAKEFMGTLGFRNNGNWAYYGEEGSTAFADALMGVKYLITQYDEIGKPYKKLWHNDKEHGKQFVYQNPFALPFAFAMTEEADTLSAAEYDHFQYQNAIAGAFTGNEHAIYRSVSKVTLVTDNITESEGTFRKTDPEKEAFVEYTFTADSRDFIYMYLSAPGLQETRVEVNGLEKQPYFTEYGWNIRGLGHFTPGEEVRLRLYLEQEEIIIDGVEFYYENVEELSRWYEDAVTSPSQVTELASSKLNGSVEAARTADRLVFSIPYDKRWTVRVDGKKADTFEVMDGLLAVSLSPGQHEFTLRYMPLGFVVGLPVTIVCLILFCGLIRMRYVRRDR
ncbi:MAG: YfhO family protein [Lachnospiraceae bacterium]|nr:YfhO family protein [Lachnospiraceae bacterium]